MKVIDPGHRYELSHLDGDGKTVLQFVKREGDGYPGNVGHHEGVIIQEVLRALIDRCKYVNAQIPCDETTIAQGYLRGALLELERRAARRHDRVLRAPMVGIETQPVHNGCGHIGCDGQCGRVVSEDGGAR